MAGVDATKNEDKDKADAKEQPIEQSNENGESDNEVGVDSGSANVAGEQGISYDMIMETLTAMQANQAKMSAQIQKLTDAQSVLVDAGAVVREDSAASIDNANDDNIDGFVSIDELDLNI